MEIYAETPKEFKFMFRFSRDGAELNIEGENRDEVFLLYSDLKEYINNEVSTRVGITTARARKLAVLVLALISIAMLFWLFAVPSENEEMRRAALESKDIHHKLDYLISKEMHRPWMPFLIMAGSIAITAIFSFTNIIESILQYFLPANVFLWGKQRIILERRKDLLNKILWGVLVALIVGVISSFLVWYFTLEKK